MVRPATGKIIALRCVVVILGGKKPLIVDFTSSMADTSGVLLSVLMLTCANNAQLARRSKAIKKDTVFMIVRF